MFSVQLQITNHQAQLPSLPTIELNQASCDAEFVVGKAQITNYKLPISNSMTIHENVPLAPLTTLQVGGSARYFAEAKREDEVREAVEFAKSHSLPLFILGGGSNIVIADSGWPGLALKIAIGGITTPPTNNKTG